MNRLISTATAAVLLLAACGDSSDDTAAPDTATADIAAEDTAAPAATDDLTAPGVFAVDGGTLTITGPTTYDVELTGVGDVISWYSGSGATAEAQPWAMDGFLDAWSSNAADEPVTFVVAHEAETVRGSFTLGDVGGDRLTGSLDVDFVRGAGGAGTNPLSSFDGGLVHLQFSPGFVAAISPAVDAETDRGAVWLYCWLNRTC